MNDILIYAVCAFVVTIIVVIIIKTIDDCKMQKAQLKAMEAGQNGAMPVYIVNAAPAQPAPAPAPSQVEVVATKAAEEDASLEIQKLTFAEKLAQLSKEKRGYYDAVKNYILSKPESKMIEGVSRVQFKSGTARIAYISIKRGTPVVEYMLPNSDISHFIKEENAEHIKVSPVVIRLENKDCVDEAKKTVDITIEHIKAEEEHRKELRREARRQKKA